jgi:hypothetical protein
VPQVGRANGQRLVFDSDGNALDPLAALAAEQQVSGGSGDDQGQVHEGAGGGGGGVPHEPSLAVTGDAPEERFQKAAAAMKA